MEKFKKLENQILEEDGIMITVNNNKRKSLCRADIILNVDFPQELLNQYFINEEAIIVNLKGNVKINKKRFNGININDYQITFKKPNDLDCENLYLFDEKDVYEALLPRKQFYEDRIKMIEKQQVKIIKLIANNTVL